MEPTNFVAPAFGAAVKTPGPHGYWAFKPAPIPRSIDLPPATVLLLSEADRALGRLAGAGRLLPNPHLLIRPYVTREALASSRIEGTQASLSDVFDAEARQTSAGELLEVTNYIRAMEHGLARLDNLPISVRLLSEVHGVLLEGVRGQERRPGEIRSSQNWIGSPDNRPATALFVPPAVEDMRTALDDLERYVHEEATVPPLVQLALLHYQFETIHPFLDGNGRLGRLLIVFLLVERQLLSAPLLYLSAYLEARRSEYYDRLQAVRERGEVIEWLAFFLTGIRVQAVDALERAERLADLREDYRNRFAGRRARYPEVVDLLFENPVLTSGRVERALGVSNPGALNLIRGLEAAETVTEVQRVSGRAKRWVATDVLALLDPQADPRLGPGPR